MVRRYIIGGITVLFLSMLLVGCGEEDELSEANLIIPGTQAAGIKLGDTLSKVKSLYGKPNFYWSLYLYPDKEIDFYPDEGLTFNINHNDCVSVICIEAPNKSKTMGGNGIGSTMYNVRQELGFADTTDGTLHKYLKKGIQFDYNSAFIVVAIYVFEPGYEIWFYP